MSHHGLEYLVSENSKSWHGLNLCKYTMEMIDRTSRPQDAVLGEKEEDIHSM